MTEYETKSLDLFARILAALEARPAASPPAARAAPATGGGMTLPNYGRSKGAPLVGASLQDLEFYANGCRRSIADPAKERWREKEKELLAAIEAEIARQSGRDHDPDTGALPPPGDDDAPF